MAGVLVNGASQSHNFGPLNLLVRMLKKPDEGSLAHNSILPHICLFPPPSPFHSLLGSFMINGILLHFDFIWSLPSWPHYFRLVNPKQRRVTLALVIVYIYSLLVVVTKYLYESVQHMDLCPWSPISPPDCVYPCPIIDDTVQ